MRKEKLMRNSTVNFPFEILIIFLMEMHSSARQMSLISFELYHILFIFFFLRQIMVFFCVKYIELQYTIVRSRDFR